MAEEKKIDASLLNSINDILSKANLDKVTAEGTGDFPELPDGYFLSELVDIELQYSKKSGNPQVKATFKTVENGYSQNEDGELVELQKTKNRTIFKYYPLSTEDQSKVQRYVSDMQKFQESTSDDTPALPKEAFTRADVMMEALEAIKGMRVYINISTTGEGENKSTWSSLISWKRARGLELPY